jgi:toxin HigB-1
MSARQILAAARATFLRFGFAKTSILDYATDLRELATPGSNLEKLKGALAGKYSIRVNGQFRIVFNFDRGEATNVTVTDYHR